MDTRQEARRNVVSITEFGPPDRLRMHVTDIRPPGKGEVLVDVEAAGINYLDIYQRQGLGNLPLPFTPGLEGVGRVREIGELTDPARSLRLGQRIAWIDVPGSYASALIVPAARAIAVPDFVPGNKIEQDMGYKSANNGAALRALASLRYFGLLEKPEDGKLAVSKDAENYQYAPDPKIKSELLLKWLRAPAIFADLLDRYPEGLPSDANLRFDLINRGFSPAAGDSAVSVFRRSAEFAGYTPSSLPRNESNEGEQLTGEAIILENGPAPVASRVVGVSKPTLLSEFSADDTDKIPVRLSEGRKAWLVIPTPFYEADKLRLKAQIDLLLTEDLE